MSKSSYIVADSWRTRGRHVVDPIRADYNDIKRGWGPPIDTYFPAEFRKSPWADARLLGEGGLTSFMYAFYR